jgi:uncharacterized Zn finger protein (UPF0148 family)
MPACPKCGVEVREGKAFCFNCGWPVSRPAAEPGEAAPEYRATLSPPPPERKDHAPPALADADQRPAPARNVRPDVRPDVRPTDAARDLRPAGATRDAHAVAAAPVVPRPAGRRFFYGKFGVWTVVALLLLIVLGVILILLSAG